MGRWLRRLVVALGWVGCAVLLSLGVAGIAAGINHPPSSGARPELTWAADRAIEPGLDAATADLRSLADDVDGLADLGRSAIAALVARDRTGLQAALDSGRQRIVAVGDRQASLRTALAALPGVGLGMEGRLGPGSIARYDALVAALPTVDGLGSSWERLALGSGPAIELATHLLAHDEIAGAAIQLGAAGKYAEAVTKLAAAEKELDAARFVRDQLVSRVDVTTLDTWIERSATYDAAVTDLWNALRKSKGRVTDAVREASAREQAAKNSLPPDTKALVVIFGDVARGGLNQAVIAVEEARGRLAAALDQAEAAALAQDGEAASPSPSTAP